MNYEYFQSIYEVESYKLGAHFKPMSKFNARTRTIMIWQLPEQSEAIEYFFNMGW